MGTADIIPGVSGGTIALITGIYERLIRTISSVNTLFVKEIFKGRFKNLFRNIKEFDFQFIVPLLIGIFIAFLSLAHLIDYLLLEQTALTYALFFGLILSSAFFVYKHAGKNHSKNFLYIILGLAFAFWFVGLNALNANHSLPVLFLSGAIAICAMILPGISGSFLLVLLNQYEFMINVIKNLQIDKLFVFSIGALIGLLSFSKLLEYLLRKHKAATMSFLTGLMIGSLRIPYGKVIGSVNSWGLTIIVAIIGFGLVFFLEKKFS
ncbi:DUF368 domain-containing protein [Bacteroidota bacterium]